MADVYNSKFVSQNIYKLNTVEFILNQNSTELDKLKDNNDPKMKEMFKQKLEEPSVKKTLN